MIFDKDLEEYKSRLVFEPLNSAEELREWMSLYLGIYFPMGVVHPDSTHSPAEAMWRIYELMKTGKSEDVPQVCMLSSRDSYKTLGAAAIEVLCMIHFKISVAHMAAIEPQSQKAVQYVELFFRKIGKYLENHGWKKNSNNKRMIEWITDDGRNIYLKIIIATIAGANCISPEAIIHKADGSTCLAKDIKAGDTLVTFNYWNNTTPEVKVGSVSYTKKQSLKIYFKEGHSIVCSNDHQIFTERGWVTADQLEPGAKCISKNKDFPISDNTPYAEEVFSSYNHSRLVRCIDTGKPINQKRRAPGFTWDNTNIANSKQGRDFRNRIKNQLNITVEKVVSLGLLDLIDIHIDSTNEHEKSFYANNILVHNSEHVPMLFIDEVDVVQNPKALEEAKMIPSVYGQYFPLTVYLSTRKFAGGLMEKTIKNTINAGGEILRWNIIDITERIPLEVARVNEPKVVRYISRELPMVNLSESDWQQLSDEHKNLYERFEAYAGIATHPMLPVMKNYLVDRNQNDYGYLYKPLSAVRNNFNQLSPDMGEAQLLCNKPSTSGLVYPRFDPLLNVISIQDCFLSLTGDIPPNTTHEYLRDVLKNLGITFIGGADWGFTDYTSLVVLAMIPNGEVWLVDSFIQDRLEPEDVKKYCVELQELWGVDKWYVDQAYPAYIKMLKTAGLKVPEFKKVVADGITAVQSKIVDAGNIRRFKILDIPKNKVYVNAFGEYKWKIDGKGDVIEGEPYHDSEGHSDALDSIRYPFQNLFIKGGKLIFTYPKEEKNGTNYNGIQQAAQKANQDLMVNKIKELAPNYQNEKKEDKPATKRKVLWM